MFSFVKGREQRQRERAEKERQREAYRIGQEGGQAIAAAIDAYLDPRLAQLQTSLLDVFAQRLLTLQDNPPHTPQTVARIEFKIFLENIEHLEPRMQRETMEAVAGWYKTAESLDLTKVFRDYVRHKAQSAKLDMAMRAVEMAADAVTAADPNAERPDFTNDMPCE